jgi:hypothetical protein
LGLEWQNDHYHFDVQRLARPLGANGNEKCEMRNGKSAFFDLIQQTLRTQDRHDCLPLVVWRREFLPAFNSVFISAAGNVTESDCLIKLFCSLAGVFEKGVNSSHGFMSA